MSREIGLAPLYLRLDIGQNVDGMHPTVAVSCIHASIHALIDFADIEPLAGVRAPALREERGSCAC